MKLTRPSADMKESAIQGFILALVLGYSAIASAASLRPVSLRCEYRVNPRSIEVANPSLSWLFGSTDASLRGQAQTAYQVLVASSPLVLAENKGNLWDSQRGDEPFCFCLGELQVFSGEENLSLNKPVVAMDSNEGWGWSKDYLTDGRNLIGEWQTGHEAILLRKETVIAKELRSATAYISGLGYYELYLNGKKVGNHVLDPGFTDYSKRVPYVTYDVSDYLINGNNAIAVMLGGGWWDLATPDAWRFHAAPWSAPPQLLLNE